MRREAPREMLRKSAGYGVCHGRGRRLAVNAPTQAALIRQEGGTMGRVTRTLGIIAAALVVWVAVMVTVSASSTPHQAGAPPAKAAPAAAAAPATGYVGEETCLTCHE